MEAGVSEIFASGRYAEYLRVMGRFHNYSLNNCILIALQKPDASLVAGYRAWQRKFGRQVSKGEKAIQIIAPAPQKVRSYEPRVDEQGQLQLDDDGQPIIDETVSVRQRFKVSNVFDVSQTTGRELPSLGVESLEGDVRKYEDVMRAIENIAPCPVVFEQIEGGAKGYFSHNPEDKRIAIQEGMSQTQTVKTAMHELAHAHMHDFTEAKDGEKRPDRLTREVQAESVAFAVADHYGVDTSDYSFGYIAGWSSGRQAPELKESMADIRAATDQIITDLDREMLSLEQARDSSLKEQALFIPEYGYLHVQERDGGWDYTLYDCDFAEVDGGVLEADVTLPEAREAVAGLHDGAFDLNAAIDLDVEDFNGKADAARRLPYMRAMTKAMPKDQTMVAKTSMRIHRPEHARQAQESREKRPLEPRPPKPRDLEIA
nr:LPD16 domain-containing protein [Adlercreutzia sp. ZJ473]